MMAQAQFAPERSQASVVKPMLLSPRHAMCKDLAKSRRFYEEFLGLEVVRHARPAMMLRLKTACTSSAVCIGEKVPTSRAHSLGVNVATREEVDRARRGAAAEGDIRNPENHKVLERHGAYGFYFQDLDNNGGDPARAARHRRFFSKGDVIDMSVHATDSAESHE